MRRAARVDNTADALKRAAIARGADVLHIGGVIDCVLLYRGRIVLVDWKSKGGDLTPAQSKLVARGWPIRFVQTEEQLDVLLKGTR